MFQYRQATPKERIKMQFEVRTTGKSNTEMITTFECGSLQDALDIAEQEEFGILQDRQTGKFYKQAIVNGFPGWIHAKPEITYHLFKCDRPVNPDHVFVDCLTPDEAFASLDAIGNFIQKIRQTDLIGFMTVARQNDEFRSLNEDENRLFTEWLENHLTTFSPDSMIRKKTRTTYHISIDPHPGYYGQIELNPNDVFADYGSLEESVAGKTAIMNYCDRTDRAGNARSCPANTMIIAREAGQFRGINAREQDAINAYRQEIRNVFVPEPDPALSASLSIQKPDEPDFTSPVP